MHFVRNSSVIVTAFVVISLSVLGTSFAETTDAVKDTTKRAHLAEQLIRVGYVRETVEGWRDLLMIADLGNCGCTSTDEDNSKVTEAWQNSVNAVFKPQQVVSELKISYVKDLTTRELRDLLAFSTSELGAKINDAFKPQPQSSGEGNIQAEFEKLEVAMRRLNSDPTRRKLINGVISASGGMDGLVDLMANIAVGTALGGLDGLPEHERGRVDTDKMNSELENGRDAAQALADVILVPSFAVVLDGISNEKLRRYREWLVTPLGKKATAVSLKAFNVGMRIQAFEIGKYFATEVRAIRL